MGFPSPSLNVVFDYFSHSCPKMCKIYLKRTLDATFLECLALTSCDVIGELLLEWACLTLQGGTTFLLTSKLADISVTRVRNICLQCDKNLDVPLLPEWLANVELADVDSDVSPGMAGLKIRENLLKQEMFVNTNFPKHVSIGLTFDPSTWINWSLFTVYCTTQLF